MRSTGIGLGGPGQCFHFEESGCTCFALGLRRTGCLDVLACRALNFLGGGAGVGFGGAGVGFGGTGVGFGFGGAGVGGEVVAQTAAQFLRQAGGMLPLHLKRLLETQQVSTGCVGQSWEQPPGLL